jgi:predicted nuclease of predicted toxin-antitoxin system
VRFLIDRCAGRRLADRLRELGHDVLESQERGSDPGDPTILLWAASEQRILVTMDKDFGHLVFLQGERHCGLVRLPDVPAQSRIEMMEQVLERHAEDLVIGAVITVRGSRIRVAYPYRDQGL